jgi:hypothetical protein
LTPYDKATPEKKKKLEREAVIAQIITGNMKRVCEERGIPLSVFRGLWEEYRETHMFDGRFFHRLEIPSTNEADNVKRMKKAIKEYHANGQRVRAQGMTKADNKDVWQIHKVPKTSFYDALKWEADNPTCKWDGDRIRQRGKVSLLTYEMETELLHWVAVSQKHSGGVDGRAVCRVGFALMASNPEHYDRVKRVPFNSNYLALYHPARPISPKQSFSSSLHVCLTLLWSCWLSLKRKHGVGKGTSWISGLL